MPKQNTDPVVTFGKNTELFFIMIVLTSVFEYCFTNTVRVLNLNIKIPIHHNTEQTFFGTMALWVPTGSKFKKLFPQI